MTPTITRADVGTLDDLTPLFDAYRRFYDQPGDLLRAHSFLHERLTRGESVIFLARLREVPVGLTQLYPSFTSVGTARIWILNDLFVDEAARGQGVGRALLRAAFDFAQEDGAARLTLNTARDNVTAQALYEAEGWVRDQQFFAYNKPVGDA